MNYIVCKMLGDLRRAEDQFRYVYERATKSQANKKKFLFGSLVGLVSRIVCGTISFTSLFLVSL